MNTYKKMKIVRRNLHHINKQKMDYKHNIFQYLPVDECKDNDHKNKENPCVIMINQYILHHHQNIKYGY